MVGNNWHFNIFCLLLLLLLMGYVLVGYTSVPFHGDEADHLHKSQDFVVAIVMGRSHDLAVAPPVAINSTEHIRLLTGSTHAYLTGYALWSMGVENSAWPQSWNYAQDVEWNQANARWPEERILQRGRLPHVIFTMLSVPLAFVIVRRYSSSYPYITGLLAAALVATHPAWLLSGRRVMQEAAFITLSLALIWWVSREGHVLSVFRLLGVSFFSALCVAAKPTGAITVLALFVAFATLIVNHPLRGRMLLRVVGSGLAAVVLYVALTPPVWGNPPSRIHLAIQLRADVLAGQTAASPLAYDSAVERLIELAEQPFIAPLQYYETDAFAGVLDDDIQQYERQGFAGWQMHQVVAWLTTGASFIGLVQLARQWRDWPSRVILLWLLITPLAFMLSIPLAWQRYYLLWSVGLCLVAPLGVVTVFKWLNGLRYFW